MKVMMFVKATAASEAGEMPAAEALTEMMAFNEEMSCAGILRDGGGLQPSAKGARIDFAGASRTVVDGPFAETKELVAGYWIIEVASMAEAIAWAKKCPNPMGDAGGTLELRPFFEMEDFDTATAQNFEQAARVEANIKATTPAASK